MLNFLVRKIRAIGMDIKILARTNLAPISHETLVAFLFHSSITQMLTLN